MTTANECQQEQSKMEQINWLTPPPELLDRYLASLPEPVKLPKTVSDAYWKSFKAYAKTRPSGNDYILVPTSLTFWQWVKRYFHIRKLRNNPL